LKKKIKEEDGIFKNIFEENGRRKMEKIQKIFLKVLE